MAKKKIKFSMKKEVFFVVFLLSAAFILQQFYYSVREEEYVRVHRGDIKSLYLSSDKMVKSRIGPNVPQLECVRGACEQVAGKKMEAYCTNLGYDGISGVWKIEMVVPKGYVFGGSAISFEGWDGPKDAYLLAGSARLEFELLEETPESSTTKCSPENPCWPDLDPPIDESFPGLVRRNFPTKN